MKSLTCGNCKNKFRGSLQLIKDGEWFYKCPKCGSLIDENRLLYSHNEEEYYDQEDHYYR